MKNVRVKYSLISYSRKIVDLDKQLVWERKVIEIKISTLFHDTTYHAVEVLKFQKITLKIEIQLNH